MYLEANDDSPKSERFRPKQRESIHYKRKSVTKFDDNKTIEEKSENDKKESEIIFVEHNEDINCKSEYAFSNDQNFSNNDDFNEEENEKPALKRGLTVKEDLMQNIQINNNNNKNKNNLNHKKILGLIRSSFYNTFKI